jgi:hypothetical protein
MRPFPSMLDSHSRYEHFNFYILQITYSDLLVSTLIFELSEHCKSESWNNEPAEPVSVDFSLADIADVSSEKKGVGGNLTGILPWLLRDGAAFGMSEMLALTSLAVKLPGDVNANKMGSSNSFSAVTGVRALSINKT